MKSPRILSLLVLAASGHFLQIGMIPYTFGEEGSLDGLSADRSACRYGSRSSGDILSNWSANCFSRSLGDPWFRTNRFSTFDLLYSSNYIRNFVRARVKRF